MCSIYQTQLGLGDTESHQTYSKIDLPIGMCDSSLDEQRNESISCSPVSLFTGEKTIAKPQSFNQWIETFFTSMVRPTFDANVLGRETLKPSLFINFRRPWSTLS